MVGEVIGTSGWLLHGFDVSGARSAVINWRRLNKVRLSSMPGAISAIAVSR